MECYRHPEHESPNDARFCVTCGVPLRQPCPYDPAHWIRVKDAEGRSPRACPECSRLLRPCEQCHRLHRLTEETCRTGTCRGLPLPPVRSDWPAARGGRERAGSARIAADAAVEPGSYRQWETRPLPGRRGAAISAYGNFYAAVGNTVYLYTDTSADIVTPRERAELPPTRHGSERGSLMAAGGLVLGLIGGTACAMTPENLTRPWSRAGVFEWQTLCGGRWLLYGVDEEQPELALTAVSLKDPPWAVRRLQGTEGVRFSGHPVVCADTLYIAGPGGRFYRLEGDTLVHLNDFGGEIVALAATRGEDGHPAVLVLTRGADFRHELHSVDHAQPARITSAAVPGTGVLDRIWTLGPHVYVARNGSGSAAADRACLLRFDRRVLGGQPQSLPWTAGMDLMDGLVLGSPDAVYLELALRDPMNNTLILTRLSWEKQAPVTLGRVIGAQAVELLVHGDSTVAIYTTELGTQPHVTARGHRLC